MNNQFLLFLVFTAISSFCRLYGQEVLTGLAENRILSQQPDFSKKSFTSDTIEIPFFDDFSYPGPYPDSTKWADRYVFVNNSFAVNPRSTGVATFDIIDAQGLLYSFAETNPFEADRLTSLPVNLAYQAKDSIYLSFFYQPQGNGNAPETADSLILEFFSPATGLWNKKWSAAGKTLQPFKQTMIPITEPEYLVKGFRFRFKNKASIAGSFDPASGGNCDQWNLDYIKLAKSRFISDTTLHDVAFTSASEPLLNTYSSMPWKHYFVAHSAELGSVSFSFLNNDSIVRNVTTQYFIKDMLHSTLIDSAYLVADNYAPYSFSYFSYPFDDVPFPLNLDDSARFQVETRIITDEYDYKPNNRAFLIQDFKDYYAYDDGSAENGYGIDSETAKLAYRFNSYIDDTLRAVDFFFNRTKNNASQQFFHLTVWSAADNMPDQVIYQKRNVRPSYGDGFNQFVTYVLDTPVFVSGLFFVGWEQTTADKLNVGFDRNFKATNRIFVNLGGSWQPSAYASSGSLLIRPRIGKKISSVIKESNDKNIVVYPNPGNNEFWISGINGWMSYSIFNIQGKMVEKNTCSGNHIIVGNLPSGLYFLHIEMPGGYKKIVKITIAH